MRKITILGAAFSLLFACGLMAQTVETIPFLTTLLPANETPPITDTSSANVIVYVHVVRDATGAITSGSVDFDVAAKFSGAVTATGLHIHKGDPTVAGPIVIPTDVAAIGTSIVVDASGVAKIVKQVQFPQASVLVSTIQDLIANPVGFYVNIHTTDHPGGAMRGQLLRAESTTLMGLMAASKEVPAVTGNQNGVATVTLMRARDSSGQVAIAEAIFNVEYSGFPSGTIFTGFHIHNGSAVVAGPVIINSGLSATNTLAADPSGAGNLNYEIPMTSLDGAARFATELDTVNGLFTTPGNYYINLHTTVFGGGAMRDQLRTVDKAVFQVNMSPANENPPITGLPVSGPSAVTFYTLRNADGSVAAGTVVFDVNYRGFPAGTQFTGLHIHQAPVGTNGAIKFFSGVNNAITGFTSDTGSGNVYKIATIATADGIASLSTMTIDPSQFYLNIHTSVNAGGAERAQLGTAAATPAIGGVAAAASTIITAAPGEIVSIYGTNLATYTSDLSGFATTITSLPTTMNGVVVTVAGVKAPFYYVSSGQLNVQIPLETAAGPQQVVVSDAGGASSSFTVTIANAAPSIFVVDPATSLGAIVKNVDFSLVTPTNKAKAGDVVVVYATGLGQTTPALKTGELLAALPGGAFNNTATVTATIGSQPATVVYSIASPGFAGLYQVALTVPSGVTGNAAVVLKEGTATSNSVNLAVQ